MYPNKEQEIMLKKTAGVARFAYNHMLTEWNRQYEEFSGGRLTERPTAYLLKKQWNATKPDFAREVYSGAPTQAILNLGAGFTNFFRHKSARPTYKKKGRNTEGFYVANDKGAYADGRVRVPNVGWVKLAEPLRFTGKIMAYHISTYAGQWHVAVNMSTDIRKAPAERKTICGIDVGLKTPAICSDGTVLKTPGQLKELYRKLKREQRLLSRKQYKSNNSNKQLIKKQKVQQRVSNIRTDAVHKFTTAVCKNHTTVVIETLSIEPMKRAAGYQSFRQAFQQSTMHEIHRQLKYKAVELIPAPAFYPSTQLCSSCGARKDMPLDVREYICQHCGLRIDRDLNAALNLMKIGAVGAESNACRDPL